MEVFNALTEVFLILLSLNLGLALFLWRATGFKPFSTLAIYWILVSVSVGFQMITVNEAPLAKALGLGVPGFLSALALALVLAKILRISVPLMKFLLLLFLATALPPLLFFLHSPAQLLSIPLKLASAFCLFYVIYQAVRHHRQQITFCTWIVLGIYALLGLHLFDSFYFENRPDLLVTDFTLNLIFHLVLSILVPTTLMESISQETARLEAEMELKEKLSQSAKMVSLGEVAGGIALEMSAPLTVMNQTFEKIESALQETADNQDLKALNQKCRSTMERMSLIVKGLLSFSKEENLEDFKSVDLGSLVHEATSLFLKQHSSVDLRIDLPPHPIQLRVQFGQLVQVLFNLFSNAQDAILNQPEKWIQLRVKEAGPLMEFTVTDSGAGLSRDIAEKIFQPFFTTKEIGKGVGLGLSVCKGIIEAHGGDIFLDETSPHTRFVFHILRSGLEP